MILKEQEEESNDSDPLRIASSVFSVTVRQVTNGRHVGYECHYLKETTSLLCSAMMKQFKYHKDISPFQSFRRITEITVSLIPQKNAAAGSAAQ